VRSFDERWRDLVRAAARAGEPPLPRVPDGARLHRRAAAAVERRPARSGRPLAALAVGLLWAVAIPAIPPAWRASQALLSRLGAPVLPVSAAPAAGAPALPRALPALVPPRPLPLPLPDLDLRPHVPAVSPVKEPS
jgi:hypothetical protein